MEEIKLRELRDTLSRRAKALSDAAIEAEGEVAADAEQSLERLKTLVDVCQSLQPAARRRWPVVAALGATLLLVSALLFIRVSKTEIELDVKVSELSFVMPQAQVLTDVLPLAALGVFGLNAIDMPRAKGRDARVIKATPDVGAALRLAAASRAGEDEGTLALAALTVPAGTRVWVRPKRADRHYELSLDAAGLSLQADVSGLVEVDIAGVDNEALDFGSPRSIVLGPSDRVDLDLVLRPDGGDVFSPQLSAGGLSFVRIDEFVSAERTLVRPVSTILSGTLYFESLNGEALTLRAGEGIRFESSQGWLRTLILDEGAIALKFNGVVSGMTTGSGERRRSLMPTYLEWMQARQPLTLLVGSTLYVFGLLMAAMRWWGMSV